MSQRRSPGDIVVKRAGAGFCGESCIIRIPTSLSYMPNISDNEDWCMLDCGDRKCREYANVEVVDKDRNVIGELCHVSECEMEDWQ